jgi:pilus assembly protein FimV
LQLRRIIAALLLFGAAIPSFALTIGRPNGAIWIGKPVDLTIPLALDPSEGGDSLCLEAEVLQGDTRIEDKRVTVSLEPGPSASTPRIHIRSTVAVDEPVITVAVKAGCTTRSTRRYVLLADVPPDISLPGVTPNNGSSSPGLERPFPNAGGASTSSNGDEVRSFDGGASLRTPDARRGSPGLRSSARARTAEGVRIELHRSATTNHRATRRPPGLVPKATPRTSPAVKPSTPIASEAKREILPPGPRLQLDALEPSAASDVELKTSPLLAAVPPDDPAKRAEAAALWRAIGSPTEDTQREAQRMQTLEASLTALREQAAQNQRILLEMRSELEEARDSRYRNPLVYSLFLLLLLALLGMFLLWRLVKRASVPVWWGEQRDGPRAGDTLGSPNAGGSDSKLNPDAATLPSGEPWQTPPSSFRSPELEVTDSAYASAFGGLGTMVARTPDGAPMRPVNTDELFDVQQQSDFFLSLGQHDQAIDVLSEHIADNPGTSALAYLDLLRIYHSLGRRDDYAWVRQEFVRAFNADVPEFDKFSQVGHGLEHYRSTLARITSQWPAPGTLALIEELVFRKPGAHGDEAFDLAAYQELLLLYSVAKEVIDPNCAPPAPVTPLSFVDTFGYEQAPTARVLTEAETESATIDKEPKLPTSLYGGIDDGLRYDTDLASAHLDMEFGELDKTAFDTMPSAIEQVVPTAHDTMRDPNIIDFDLFDPATEAEIAPKAPPRKR